MSLKENKELARRFFHGAWNDGNMALIDDLIPPDALDHSSVAGKEPERGPGSFKFIIGMFRSALEGIRLTIDDEIAEGDKVVHRWTIRGKHTAPLFGVPPTGKDIAFTGTTTVRIVEGRIVERWANVDELNLLRQLGVVPPAPGS
jgi:predicted ester cyclase